MIKPTVGRVLWFYPSIAYAASMGMAYGVPGEPLTALIAHVINDNMVNLSVYDQNGKQFNATSVPLLDEPPELGGYSFYATWPLSQKEHAAKAEALESKQGQGVDKLLETRIPILDQITELCYAIEKCGASPELTDAVTKAAALREPISELVRQAIDLGIGTGLVGVSHSNQAGDLPTPTTAQCGHGFNDRSFVTRDLVMNLICQGKPADYIKNEIPQLLELIFGIDPDKTECDRGPDIELAFPSMGDTKRSAPPVEPSISELLDAKDFKAPRITPADVEANIANEHYFTAADGINAGIVAGYKYPGPLDLLTICVLTLQNGFTVTGESACASPENFDAEIGRKIARKNAVEKIWPLMGYELKQRLHEQLNTGFAAIVDQGT